MANMHLSELVDFDSMTVIQNGFSKLTGMSVSLVDADGVPVTPASKYSRFCFELTRSTMEGRSRCEHCDRMGALRALRCGKPEAYTCHAGLCDFSAPILVDGRFMGSLIGGQVLTDEPDEEAVRATASELGVDPDAYVQAIHEVPVIGKEKIEFAMEYLTALADIISKMAYNNYMTFCKSRELENMTRMKLEFLSTINYNINKPLREMLNLTSSIKREELPEHVVVMLRRIEKMNQNVINTLADAMAFSEMTRTDSDIIETEYSLATLCEGLKLTYTGRLMERPIEFQLNIEEDVPVELFGDVTRIRQILVNLLNNAVQYTKEGRITLHIYQKKTTYGIMVYFEISDTGIGMDEEQLHNIREMFEDVRNNRLVDEDVLAFGLGMTGQLVNAVYGDIQVASTLGQGSVFTVVIPQMSAKG